MRPRPNPSAFAETQPPSGGKVSPISCSPTDLPAPWVGTLLFRLAPALCLLLTCGCLSARGVVSRVSIPLNHDTPSAVGPARDQRQASRSEQGLAWRLEDVFATDESRPLFRAQSSPAVELLAPETGDLPCCEAPPSRGCGPSLGGYTSPLDSSPAEDLRERPCGFTYLKDVTARLLVDERNFYDANTLGPLVVGLGLGAIVANTQLDREISERFQNDVRNKFTDNVASVFKPIGDGYIMGPVYAVAFAASLTPHHWEPLQPFEEWGERSFRAALVGAVPMLLLQKITGADRPDMSDHGSRWIPWKENHGVSGHAFMGAIPFLTAAKMTDNRAARIALTIASTGTAWSRVNDNDHYFSQAALGWFMGWLAVEAVADTEFESGSWRVVPIPASHGDGIGLETRW